MNRLALLALALCAAAHAAHAAEDRLDSAACKVSRVQLDSATAAMSKAIEARANTEGPARTLRAARERTAQACFGLPSDSAAGLQRPASKAVAVPPIDAPALRPAQAMHSAPNDQALNLTHSQALTVCDSGGCWDSNGQRLNRVGPELVGPRGVCNVQGALANCP